jgi:superkiller protein 3
MNRVDNTTPEQTELTRKRTIESMEHFRRAIDLKNDYDEAYESWGMALLRLHKTDDAIDRLNRAEELAQRLAEPDRSRRLARIYDDLGMAQETRGEIGVAKEMYQRSIAANPRQSRPHYNYGRILEQEQKIDEAIAEYQKAVDINPNSYDSQYRLGHLLLLQKKTDDAMDHLRRAIELNEDFAEARMDYGTALARGGFIDEAAEQFLAAAQLRPHDGDSYAMLGFLAGQRGHLEQARKYFQIALEAEPGNSKAKLGLARIDDAIRKATTRGAAPPLLGPTTAAARTTQPAP